METIIQQILSEVVAEILEKLENFVTVGINETVSSLEAASSKMILNIIKAAVGSIDEELVEGTKALRKQDHITVKERRVPRIIQTRFGDLEYERTYFRLGDGSYVYLTDQVIGVTPYSRISEEVIASILQRTSTQSYQDAIDSTKANTTRQTVHNRLVALDELTAEARRAEKTPEELHLFADEDHVHLNPKGCAIVPLVSITEGIDTSNPKRHKTINPFHIAGYGMGTDAFKENVAAVMAERYDLDKVKHIFIHADGGKWIESLTGILPNAEIIMDGFHLEKHLKRYLRLTGASCYAGQIRRALREGDIESFRKYSSKIYSRQTSEDDRDKADDFVTYALGHWNAIVLRMNGRICGSCTEPLVSHTLSQRLSRDPIAWSRKGLSKMTMLLVYTKNGGVVEAKDIRIRANKEAETQFKEYGYSRYKDYADKQIKEVFSGHCNWDLFEKRKNYTLGKVDATFTMLRAFGKIYPITNVS